MYVLLEHGLMKQQSGTECNITYRREGRVVQVLIH